MLNFSLPSFTEVLVRSVNVRSERHGTEEVPAIDIGVRFVVSNKVLDEFSPDIRKAFYKAAPKSSAEPELEGVEPLSDTPVRKLTMIEMPLALVGEGHLWNCCIDYGLGGKSNLEFAAGVNKFEVHAMHEGGSIELDWRLQVSNVDANLIGKVGALVKHKTLLTMVSGPESDNTKEKGQAQLPIDGTVGHPGAAKGNTKAPPDGPNAGDIFSAKVKAGETRPAKAPAKKSTKPALKTAGRAKPRTGKGN
jgi:hypothetical protein